MNNEGKEELAEYEEECYWQSYRELTVVGDSQNYGEEVWLAQVTHKRSKRKRVKASVSRNFKLKKNDLRNAQKLRIL